MNATLQALALRREAAAILAEWDLGGEPDAQAALARRPELRADRSVALDLAYEEYCRRREKGERPDPDAFCDRFSSHRQSLRVLITGHQYIDDHVSLLKEAPPVRWPQPGEQLGDFTLLRQLGRGAFARVYLALEASTGGRPVVVKLSPEGDAEARTQGRLSHPNIVPVLSARFEEGAGLTAVCMPFLGAATLIDVLEQAYPTADAPPPRRADVVGRAIRAAAQPGDPPPLVPTRDGPPDESYPEAVVRLAVQIADALAFLHKEGVCHRDLKPSNVLLCPDGQALLLDFNLSADARSAPRQLGGTFPYAAPEQLQALIHPAEHGGLDQRADLFSLGAILYELLTGKPPYGPPPAVHPVKAAAAVMLERQRTKCVPLRILNPEVDRGLAGLIEGCLAFDPSSRPASAAIVAAAFRRYLGFPAKLRRFAARKPWAVAAMGGLLLLAAGGAAWDLASQGPAHVQDYVQGRDAFTAGDYDHAAEWFQKALQDCPGDAKPRKYYLAHAAALLRQDEEDADPNKVKVADQDLGEADRQQSDGTTMALIGYCSSRLKQHEAAIGWYDDAAAAGFASAGLYNDRGLDRMLLNQPEEARADFDAALQFDPNLQAALYNRALLAFRQRPRINPPPPSDAVLDDMQRAAELGPGSQELYLIAAKVFGTAAQQQGPSDPKGRASQALLYLHKSLDCGLDPESIRKDATFIAVLKPFPEFATLLATPRQPSGRMATPRLVNPAPSLPD